jgi:hypothetical protein
MNVHDRYQRNPKCDHDPGAAEIVRNGGNNDESHSRLQDAPPHRSEGFEVAERNVSGKKEYRNREYV